MKLWAAVLGIKVDEMILILRNAVELNEFEVHVPMFSGCAASTVRFGWLTVNCTGGRRAAGRNDNEVHVFAKLPVDGAELAA